MTKNKNKVADVQGMTTEKKREVSIELMNDFMVHIATLAREGNNSGYSHTVKVPSKLLKGVDKLKCTLDYPLCQPHTFTVSLEKTTFKDITLIDVDSLCTAVANEYARIEKIAPFVFHALSDLWIEAMEIEGDRLVVYVGS